ncbi:hypothetical protein LGV59_07070 [Bacteroides fragilis]|nr:hypothetical protein [Bacteroides fragilis]
MEKRFSKIFSIVVYAFLALWMGACKSEPIRLPELSGHRERTVLLRRIRWLRRIHV